MKTTGKNVCAMSEDCEGKDADRGMMCAEHRAEDEEMRAAMDRAYYRGTPMEHIKDAIAYMVAGIGAGNALAQEMAMREAAMQGRSLVIYTRDENYGLHIEHISMDEYIDHPVEPYPIEIFDEKPTVPLKKVWRDHGHPRSPKASRRKGR